MDSQALATNGPFYFILVPFVCSCGIFVTRLCLRRKWHALSIDDILLSCAMVLYFIVFAISVAVTLTGSMAPYEWSDEVPAGTFNGLNTLAGDWVAKLLTVVILFGLKLSALFTFRKSMPFNPKLSLAINCGFGLVAIMSLISAIAYLAACMPLSNLFSGETQSAYCLNYLIFSMLAFLTQGLSDIYLMIIPFFCHNGISRTHGQNWGIAGLYIMAVTFFPVFTIMRSLFGETTWMYLAEFYNSFSSLNLAFANLQAGAVLMIVSICGLMPMLTDRRLLSPKTAADAEQYQEQESQIELSSLESFPVPTSSSQSIPTTIDKHLQELRFRTEVQDDLNAQLWNEDDLKRKTQETLPEYSLHPGPSSSTTKRGEIP